MLPCGIEMQISYFGTETEHDTDFAGPFQRGEP